MQPPRNSRSVLVIPSWYPPRGGEFFRDHARALAVAGMEVSVVSLDLVSLKRNPDALWRRKNISSGFEHGIREYSAHCPIIPFLARPNARMWIRRMIQLGMGYIEEHGRPGIIQAHSSIWAGVAAAAIKKLTGIPYVLTEHRGRFVNNNPQAGALFRDWHYPLIREAFGNADKIVTVSRALNEKIASISSVHEADIMTIPNLTDTSFFQGKPATDSPGTFTFFSLAHLVPEKGMDTLIEAAAILKHDKTDFRVIIGGDGSERASLEQAVRDASIDPIVRFTGKLSKGEVRDWLLHSHAFVLPSHFEAFGVVLIEAMACGLPVIGTRSGGPEFIVGDETEMLVDPGDAFALAKAMRRMIDRIAGYDQAQITRYATERFNPEVVAGQYAALYEQITGGNTIKPQNLADAQYGPASN